MLSSLDESSILSGSTVKQTPKRSPFGDVFRGFLVLGDLLRGCFTVLKRPTKEVCFRADLNVVKCCRKAGRRPFYGEC